MKETILFFVILIGMMMLVEIIALTIPGWFIASLFFGGLFYGMFRLVRHFINSNQ